MNGVKRSKNYVRFQYMGVMLFMWPLLQPLVTQPIQGAQVPYTQTKGHGLFPGTGSKKEGNMAERILLTEEEGKMLLDVARKTIQAALFAEKGAEAEDTALPPIFHEPRGTFVTLTIDGNLRGCIGHIQPQEPLIDGIRANAMNAAFRDPRFRPLTEEEWPKVAIEISILTEPQSLPYSNEADLLQRLRPGVDGVILKKGYQQSTFLPQVWEQLPNPSEFLAHLCLKAGLPADAWKQGDLDVSTYQVQAFEESPD